MTETGRTTASKGGGTRDRAPAPRRTVFSLSEAETYEFGMAFARSLSGGDLLLLEGDLGLGKTVFARGVAAGIGVAPEDVTSPSFTLVQEYTGGRVPLFHIDLYRIEDPEEVETLGIQELVSGGAVTVIEWGERLPMHLRRGGIVVRFHDVGEESRRIEILPTTEPEARPRGDA